MAKQLSKRENSKYKILARRIMAGEYKTSSEWAKEFGSTKHAMQQMISHARKRNYMLYPIGGGHDKEGVIKEVTKNVRDYRETSNRISKNYVNPNVIGSFLLRENYLLEDSSRREEIEMTANEFVKMVEGYKQRLLQSKNK